MKSRKHSRRILDLSTFSAFPLGLENLENGKAFSNQGKSEFLQTGRAFQNHTKILDCVLFTNINLKRKRDIKKILENEGFLSVRKSGKHEFLFKTLTVVRLLKVMARPR